MTLIIMCAKLPAGIRRCNDGKCLSKLCNDYERK